MSLLKLIQSVSHWANATFRLKMKSKCLFVCITNDIFRKFCFLYHSNILCVVCVFMEIHFCFCRWPNKKIKVGRISNEYPFWCEHMSYIFFIKICHTTETNTNERPTNTPGNFLARKSKCSCTAKERLRAEEEKKVARITLKKTK